MAQIKTPEQIAIRPLVGIESRLEELGITITSDVEVAIKRGIAQAIEADRVQRSRVLDALHTWAVDVSYSLSTDKSNDWSEELDELASIERFYGLHNRAVKKGE